MKDGVLILSVWGYPPQWTRYRYTVAVDHPAYRDLGESECESCCTTIVLAHHLMKKYRVKTVVFGADTVADPSTTEDTRSKALLLYEGWLRELSSPDNCSCCSETSWLKSVDISVLPGIGHYHGWYFKASIDNVFVQAFTKIFCELQGGNYRWIFLDLSHGLNYLLVAVLYATVANAVLFGVENRLILVNSEPARAGSKRCIKVSDAREVRDARKDEMEPLGILDVSRLQAAVNLVRSLIALRYFQPIQMGAILKELRERYSQTDPELEELNKVLPFFKLLSNTIVGPTFVHSYTVDSSGREELLHTALCREYRELRDRDVAGEFKPRKNGSLKTVEYDSTSIFRALPIALGKIVSDVCEKLVVGGGDRYLVKYLDNVGRYYRDESRSIHSSLIVENTKEDLGKVVEFVVKNRGFLEKCYSSADLISTRGTEIEINGALFRAVNFKKRDTLNKITKDIEDGKTGCKDLGEQLEIDTIKTNLDEERREIYSSSSNSNLDRFLRNMCAHAGFEYTSIRRMVIDTEKRDIVKIVYDKDILFKILRDF
ncbi:MAG: TM1812 family CRISPR-associated protein [Ignisphaera sp.]